MSHELMSPAEYQLHELEKWLDAGATIRGVQIHTSLSSVRPDKYCVHLNGWVQGRGATLADAIADALRQVTDGGTKR